MKLTPDRSKRIQKRSLAFSCCQFNQTFMTSKYVYTNSFFFKSIYCLYRVCQGFRLSLDNESEIIIFESLLTTFEANSTFWDFWGFSGNWLEHKTKPLVPILDSDEQVWPLLKMQSYAIKCTYRVCQLGLKIINESMSPNWDTLLTSTMPSSHWFCYLFGS